jgi:hypothetical protein
VGARLGVARRCGEATMSPGAVVLAVIIVAGYGGFGIVGLLSTDFLWPTLLAVAFVAWRNRPRRRQRSRVMRQLEQR